MAKLRDRLRVWARVALGSLVTFEERRVPAERKLALDWRRRRDDFRRMLEEAADVGEAASGLVRALAEAKVLEARIEHDLETHVQAEKQARARNGTAVAERESHAATALADSLAQAERNVRELEALVNEALQNNERARRMVLEQAVRLSELAGTDARLVALIQTNEMRSSTLQLQKELRQLDPGERAGFRGRALAAAEHIGDELAAREELTGGTWSADRPATEAGAEHLARVKARLGLASPDGTDGQSTPGTGETRKS